MGIWAQARSPPPPEPPRLRALGFSAIVTLPPCSLALRPALHPARPRSPQRGQPPQADSSKTTGLNIADLRSLYFFFLAGFPPPDGGRVLAGGGLFIPSRNSSPVSRRFQFIDIRCCVGCSIVIAPGAGHSSTHPPQYQHSSGYSTMGGCFLSGLGIITSVGQTSTHLLHLMHISSLNSTALFGRGELGTI